MTQPEIQDKISYHCESCQGEELGFMTDAVWNPDNGEMELLFKPDAESAFCYECGEEVDVVARDHDTHSGSGTDLFDGKAMAQSDVQMYLTHHCKCCRGEDLSFTAMAVWNCDSHGRREKRAKVGDALRGGISWRCSDAVNSLQRKGYDGVV